VNPAFDSIDSTDSRRTDASINTGIAIEIPSPAPAYVLARLWDPVQEHRLTSNVITLPASRSHRAISDGTVSRLLNISQLRAKISIDSCSTSSCRFAEAVFYWSTAIRLNGDQFTTNSCHRRAVDGDQVRILSSSLWRAGRRTNMKTVLYYHHKFSTECSVQPTFRYRRKSLTASTESAGLRRRFFHCAGNRVRRLYERQSKLRSGWIRLTAVGPCIWLRVRSSRLSMAPPVSEASVLESAPITRGLILREAQSGAVNVGVALATRIRVQNTILSISSTKSDSRWKPAKWCCRLRTSCAVRDEIFPELASLTDFDGALSIHSSTGVLPRSAAELDKVQRCRSARADGHVRSRSGESKERRRSRSAKQVPERSRSRTAQDVR